MVGLLLFIPFFVMSASGGCWDDGNSIFVCKGFIGQQYFADTTTNNKFRIIRFVNTEFTDCSKGVLNLAKFKQLKMVYFSDTADCDCTCLGPNTNVKTNCPDEPRICRIPRIQSNGGSSPDDRLSLADTGPQKTVDDFEFPVKEQRVPSTSSDEPPTTFATFSTKSNSGARSGPEHQTKSHSATTFSPTTATAKPSSCLIFEWSEWSDCVFNTNDCQEVGYRYRTRNLIGQTCKGHNEVEKKDCKPRCEITTKKPVIIPATPKPTATTTPRWRITPAIFTSITTVSTNGEKTEITTPQFGSFTTTGAPPSTPIDINNKSSESENTNNILAWISGAGGMVSLVGFVGLIVKHRCKVRRRGGGVEAVATTECWLLKRLGIGRDQRNDDMPLQRIERMLHRLEAARLRDLEKEIGEVADKEDDNSDYGTVEIGSVGTSGHELLSEIDENE